MRATMLLAALAAAAACTACESVPLVAPTQSTIRLVIADTTVPNGGSTPVTATVTESSGTAVHDGTVVTFSTTLGSVHPPEAPTARGRAVATFTAGAQSGVADLVAYSGAAVSETVQITIGAAAAASLQLTARPVSLPPAGGTATLIATVLDGAQNPLPGVNVAFRASAGALRDRVVATDRSGEAQTELATTTPAEVTATVGENTATVSIRLDEPTAISIRATPAQPVAGQVVSFEVTLRNDARAVHSARIDFGDGSVRELGVAERVTVTHAYAAAGTYAVAVTATDVAGHVAASSISVRVDPAPQIPITVTASPAAPVAGQPVTFTVDVSPPGNAPAVREVTIDFGDDSAASLGALTGRRSIAHVYDRAGSYIVAVAVRDAAGGRHAASIGVQVAAAPSIPVTVTAAPAAPVAGRPVAFTVEVSPPRNAPAVREVTVDFGDGSGTSLGALNGRTSVGHVYENGGRYSVTATVRDAADRRHTASIGIVVAGS